LKIKIDKSFKKQRKTLSSSYLKNKNKIIITDAGVGSKKLGNERIVSHIYKLSSTKGKYADLLFKLVNYYQPYRILEMGTSLGFGTYHLAGGNVNGKVLSIDACINTQNIAKSSLQKLQFDNIDFFNDTFLHFFESYGLCRWASRWKRFDSIHDNLRKTYPRQHPFCFRRYPLE
jgi:hypothetical protein